jgi:hypothetical protein
MRSDFGQKHLKHVMTEAQPQNDMAGKQMAANVPTAGGSGRFGALERVGQGYQPPKQKPIKPTTPSGG